MARQNARYKRKSPPKESQKKGRKNSLAFARFDWLLDHLPELRDAECRVLFAIVVGIDGRTLESFRPISIKNLAEQTGRAKRTVAYALKGLRESGLIERDLEPGRPNRYRLLGVEAWHARHQRTKSAPARKDKAGAKAVEPAPPREEEHAPRRTGRDLRKLIDQLKQRGAWYRVESDIDGRIIMYKNDDGSMDVLSFPD